MVVKPLWPVIVFGLRFKVVFILVNVHTLEIEVASLFISTALQDTDIYEKRVTISGKVFTVVSTSAQD